MARIAEGRLLQTRRVTQIRPFSQLTPSTLKYFMYIYILQDLIHPDKVKFDKGEIHETPTCYMKKHSREKLTSKTLTEFAKMF